MPDMNTDLFHFHLSLVNDSTDAGADCLRRMEEPTAPQDVFRTSCLIQAIRWRDAARKNLQLAEEQLNTP